MQVKNFEELGDLERGASFNAGNLRFNQESKVFKGLWLTRSNPTRSGFHHVEHRRRI